MDLVVIIALFTTAKIWKSLCISIYVILLNYEKKEILQVLTTWGSEDITQTEMSATETNILQFYLYVEYKNKTNVNSKQT